MTGRQPSRGGASFCAVLLVAAIACRTPAPEEIESETVVAVRTVPAVRGSIRSVVQAAGVIGPAPGAELIVLAPTAARIAEIPPAAGDRVKRGNVLVRFDLPDAAAEVTKKEAEIARTETALQTERSALTRSRELFERGIAARKEVEQASRAAADAEAALVQARASLAAARAVAEGAVVRAPFDGVISARLHNPGDFVESSASDPVLRVIDPRRLEVLASVPVTEAPRIKVGAPARLTASAERTAHIPLKVVSTPAAVEQGTATVPVRLAPAVSANLTAGTAVQVEIAAEQHDGVVVVPSVAIVREGEQAAVFVASGGRAHRQPVQIGLTDGRHTEITSGVEPGEMVIVDGQNGLPDGAAVKTSPSTGETGK